MELLETPHLFTVREYMALDIEARTELLGGVIYDVSPRNEPHCFAVRVLTRSLARGLDAKYILQIQDAVAVEGWQGRDASEVDVAILLERRYDPGPTGRDAVAFIEVADTTYTTDRRYKISLYVAAGIPSYIVNISMRQVERYASPANLEAEHGHVSTEHDTLEIAGVRIPISTLFV